MPPALSGARNGSTAASGLHTFELDELTIADLQAGHDVWKIYQPLVDRKIHWRGSKRSTAAGRR